MRFLNKGVLLLVVIVFAMAMCTAVRAQTRDDSCVLIAQIARTVMKSRQAGVPMERLYGVASMSETKYMVVEAYKIPRFKTPEFVESEVDEFAARMMGQCLRGDL